MSELERMLRLVRRVLQVTGWMFLLSAGLCYVTGDTTFAHGQEAHERSDAIWVLATLAAALLAAAVLVSVEIRWPYEQAED